jgi:signal transduction histidine kinase/CheY-like chemotaxis protein
MNHDAADGIRKHLAELCKVLVASAPGEYSERWLRFAATLLRAPAAMLVVVDNGGEVCKGGYGLPGPLLPGAAVHDFRVAACLARDETLAVAEVQRDPRLNAGTLHSAGKVGALAAVTLGVPFADFPAYIAVLDFQARSWTPQELDQLRQVHQGILQELEAGWLRAEVERGREEARRERRAKLNLLAGIPDGFFVLDTQGRCLLLNSEAGRFFQGISQRAPEELIGQDLWQTCPEVVDSSFAREYREALAEGRDFVLETYIPGRRRWFLFHGRRRPEGLYLTFRDITEQHEHSLWHAEQQAAADRRREEFVMQLAHEIRNSLVPIRTALHLAGQARDLGTADVRHVQALAEREVQDLCGLLDDLLTVSQVYRDLPQPQFEPVDMVALITAALRDLLSSPLYRGHSLDVRLPPEALHVAGDPAMLQRVLTHLLENAAKFTETGGRIEVEAKRQGPSVLIRVRDNGVGMAADKVSQVFDLFGQVDQAEGRRRGGVGVGLPLVRRLVTLHGGDVTAQSDGPGRGSTFSVRLRALVVSQETAAPASSPSDGRKPTRARVIDNSTETAQSFALLLQRWGYEVLVAYDPLTALELAQAQPPQVVLLDIGMPHMDGYEVARRLRQREECKKTVLVAITGFGEEEDRRRAREAGFDYHMVKPVDPEELRQLLAQAEVHDAPQSSQA